MLLNWLKRRINRPLEEKNKYLEDEVEYYRHIANQKNSGYRQLNNLIKEYEKAGPIRTRFFNEVKTIVNDNVEKKLSDEIFPHFTSNSR